MTEDDFIQMARDESARQYMAHKDLGDSFRCPEHSTKSESMQHLFFHLIHCAQHRMVHNAPRDPQPFTHPRHMKNIVALIAIALVIGTVACESPTAPSISPPSSCRGCVPHLHPQGRLR